MHGPPIVCWTKSLGVTMASGIAGQVSYLYAGVAAGSRGGSAVQTCVEAGIPLLEPVQDGLRIVFQASCEQHHLCTADSTLGLASQPPDAVWHSSLVPGACGGCCMSCSSLKAAGMLPHCAEQWFRSAACDHC